MRITSTTVTLLHSFIIVMKIFTAIYINFITIVIMDVIITIIFILYSQIDIIFWNFWRGSS